MSFSFNSVRYGWIALSGVVLTGATIFVVANARLRISQRDVIEVVLGTWERCEATRTGSNSWDVVPITTVRQWMDGTNTVIVTNAIGWRKDHTILSNCQAKIRAVIPYYYNTNAMGAYTVTGLWAQLEIGNKTNQFTRVPAKGTNAAQYGDIQQTRIYTNTLVEMYKILYTLQCTTGTVSPLTVGHGTGEAEGSTYTDITNARNAAIANYATNTDHVGEANFTVQDTAQEDKAVGYYYCTLVKYTKQYSVHIASTDIQHRVSFFLYPYRVSGAKSWFNDQGLGLIESNWNNIGTTDWSYSTNASTNFGGDITVPPATGVETPDGTNTFWTGFVAGQNPEVYPNQKVVNSIEWRFQYATNKFW